MKPISINNVEAREVLIQNDQYKMICFVFEQGKGLPNHKHNGLAAIQVVEGTVDMEFTSGESFVLTAGDVLGFDASVEHNVIAREKSKVIVTILL